MGPYDALICCRTSNEEQFMNPCVSEWIMMKKYTVDGSFYLDFEDLMRALVKLLFFRCIA